MANVDLSKRWDIQPDQSEVISYGNTALVADKNSGMVWDPYNADSYMNMRNQLAAWARDDAIRREGYAREDSYFQRLFDDAEKAGINPALLISGLSGNNYQGQTSASTFKTANSEEQRIKHKQQELSAFGNAAKIAGTIAAILGAIAMFA